MPEEGADLAGSQVVDAVYPGDCSAGRIVPSEFKSYHR